MGTSEINKMLLEAAHQVLFKMYGPYYQDLTRRICRDCNLNYKTARAILTKTRPPSFETFAKICERLGVTFIMTPGQWRLVYKIEPMLEAEENRLARLSNFDHEYFNYPENVSKLHRKKNNMP